MTRWIATNLLALIVLAGAAGSAGPQEKPSAPSVNVQIAVPEPYKLDMLIRSALIALHHANQTGNYTVFRDLAAPGFQGANSAADLGAIFANLRNQKLDLIPIIFFRPVPFRQPHVDERGMLRLTGYFPTEPLQVNFDLAYQNVGEDWRLFGISVEATPAVAPVAQAPAATANTQTVASKTRFDFKPKP